MSSASPPTSPCPPHHWMIDDRLGHQRWSCQKCGLVRDPERRPADTRRLANVCTWSRDEVALMDDDPEA
jgi:Zn-finger protein